MSSAVLAWGTVACWEHGLHVFPLASRLWVWLLLFLLLLESVWLVLHLWVYDLRGRLVRCFRMLGAWTVLLALSVLGPSPPLLFLQWLEHTSFLWTLPPHPTLMSRPASLKVNAASWESSRGWVSPELPLWAGRVLTHTAVWLGLEPSTDFGDKRFLRLAVQSVWRRLAAFALVYMLAFISLGLQSAGLRWPKRLVFWCLNRETGRFWFPPIFEKVLYWGPFHIHIFPLFLVCQSLASGAGPLELAS